MSTPFPPPGYVMVKSKVDGIEVYAPASKGDERPTELVEFTCPQCGATTAFGVAEGGLRCTHCGYVQSAQAPAVGRRAQEQEFTVETVAAAERGWGAMRRELFCGSCGAVLSVAGDSLTAICAFCGSNKVVQRDEVQEVLRPRFVIPFKQKPETCRDITRAWLGSSWMTPKELANTASQGSFTGVFLPFWTFDSVTRASWRAEVGHTITESYYERGEHKTRTRIQWRWESGSTGLDIDDLVIPGSARVSKLLLEKINQYNLSELNAYAAEFLAGYQAQAYETPLEQSWELAREMMREQTRKACVSQASTSMVRNFSMSLDFSDESWRYILLPVYISTYRFQEKTFQVLVNGQTGLVAGQRPVDWQKVGWVIAALLVPGAAIAILGLLTLLIGGIGVPIAIFGFILLLLGMVVSWIIYRQADALDDA